MATARRLPRQRGLRKISTTNLSYSKSDTNGSFQKLIAAQQLGFNPVDPVVGVPNFVSVFSASQMAAEAARGAGFWDAEANSTDPESRRRRQGPVERSPTSPGVISATPTWRTRSSRPRYIPML
jgi:hypothetical protein